MVCKEIKEKRLNKKKYNGYFTVEASLVMPLVLGLYVLILSAAMLLYNRCVNSQDCFLLAMRAGRFTEAKESYGEIIYGEAMEEQLWEEGSAKEYVKDRLQKKSRYYIGTEENTILYSQETDRVRVEYDRPGIRIQKSLQIYNPVKLIREGRR